MSPLLMVALLAQAPANAAPEPTYPQAVVVLSRRAGLNEGRGVSVLRQVSQALRSSAVPFAEEPQESSLRLAANGTLDTAGCEGERSCVSRLGTFLGAHYVVAVEAGRVGTMVAVHLEVLDVSTSTAAAQADLVLETPLVNEKLLAEIKPFALALKALLSQALPPPPVVELPPEVPPAPAVAVEAPAAVPPAVSAAPLKGDDRPPLFSPYFLAARGEAELTSLGGAAGAMASWSGRYAGVALSALFARHQSAARLEARAHPLQLGPLRPFLALGLVGFAPTSDRDAAGGLRAAAGAELALGQARLFADVGFERFLTSGDSRFREEAALVGAGAGWQF